MLFRETEVFARTAVIGIIAIIIIAIFFVGFGQWFIPLLLMAAVFGFAYFSGATKTTPIFQIFLCGIIAFVLGWGIQKLSIYMVGIPMSIADIPSDISAITLQHVMAMFLTLVISTVIIAFVVLPLLKRRWRY